jgi:hypothetical protein
MFLSRIVSGRRDGSSSGTLIRYDIALEAEESLTNTGIGAAQVAWLLDQWWDQRLLGAQRTWPLGGDIDRLLESAVPTSGESVDSLLEHGSPGVQEALRELAHGDRHKDDIPASQIDWVGSAHPRISSYLHAAPKLAYFVGTTPEDAEAGLGLAPGILVVVDGDSGEHSRSTPRSTAPKAAAASKPRTNQRSHQIKFWKRALAGVALLAVALYVLSRILKQ